MVIWLFVDRFVWFFHCLFCWLVDLLDWLLAYDQFLWLLGWLIGWLVFGLCDRLIGLVGWLVICFCDWLVD